MVRGAHPTGERVKIPPEPPLIDQGGQGRQAQRPATPVHGAGWEITRTRTLHQQRGGVKGKRCAGRTLRKRFRRQGLTGTWGWVINPCCSGNRQDGLSGRNKIRAEGLTESGRWVTKTSAGGDGKQAGSAESPQKELDNGKKAVIIIITENLLFEN
jgi:hypothetical protein